MTYKLLAICMVHRCTLLYKAQSHPANLVEQVFVRSARCCCRCCAQGSALAAGTHTLKPTNGQFALSTERAIRQQEGARTEWAPVAQTRTLAAGLAAQPHDALRRLQEEQGQHAWLRACRTLAAPASLLRLLPGLQ